MRNFFRSRLASFRPALEGFRYVWHTQPNAKIHAVISLVVIAAGLWMHLDFGSWALIVLAMTMVWLSEFANTAIEVVVDLVSPDHHSLAKVAKDVSAAFVVIAALAAVMIGILVLGPPLWVRAAEFFSSK
ncbi:MAG TPA: diacylglycerol kinase family protein [Anaerolineales bacterium]|nr:diacylglycerol kinase family protein [Anaerolineales bacterium]